jgi:hypothetical protein
MRLWLPERVRAEGSWPSARDGGRLPLSLPHRYGPEKGRCALRKERGKKGQASSRVVETSPLGGALTPAYIRIK